MGTRPKGKRQLSRRGMLKTGATALGGGALLLGGGGPLDAAPAQAPAQAPAIATGTQTGRTFRGFVRHDATLDVQEMRLLPTDPRQVVIRSLAVAPCYTIVRGALNTTPIRRAEVPNHCGFGVVEAVGAMVKRVQIGDRVRLRPSHTDPTVNLHDVLYAVEGERVVEVWPVTARGYRRA